MQRDLGMRLVRSCGLAGRLAHGVYGFDLCALQLHAGVARKKAYVAQARVRDAARGQFGKGDLRLIFDLAQLRYRVGYLVNHRPVNLAKLDFSGYQTAPNGM
jgi:hypothetical protein